MDAWDFRQQALMGGAYAPILGNFPSPTRPQSAVDLGPDTSSTWSSSYPTTTAAPVASAATSYRYSPRTSTGRRNRYAEIMSQYEQAQPYSFTSMPPSYTGGYDVAQPQAAAPVTRYEEIMAQTLSGGGGRGMSADEGGTFTEPTSEQAYNVSTLGRNLRYVSPLAGLLTSAYGNYLAGQVNPNYSNEGRNYPAPTGGFLSSEAAPSTDSGVTYSTGTGDFSSQYGLDQYGPGISAGESLNQQMAQDRADAAGSGSRDAGGERGYSGDNSGDNAGWGSRDAGGDGFAQGGHVSMQRLQGPDPEGPDDGYAALKDGEFVINDKAVKKYGIELMQAINSGKISKGKLRGLLEM